MTLPQVFRGSGSTLFQLQEEPQPGPQPDGLVLFLYINFSVLGRDIRGYIAMLLDMPSLAALKRLVQEFIESVMSDDTDVA
jgi:chemotaxis protein CheC